MFKKSKSKHSINTGSKESLDSSGNQSSSNENLNSLRDYVYQTSNTLHQRTAPTLSEVHYLGMIKEVNLCGTQGKDSRTPDVQLIDKLEEAQLEGKISLVPKDEDLVAITISKHGVKVLEVKNKEVIMRHPLHTVAQIVYYSDSFYKSNIALKIGQIGRSVFDCYVFQCFTEDQAQKICQSCKDVFEMISSSST